MRQEKTKKRRSLRYYDARAGFLFSLPFIIGFFLFALFPILQSILLSFKTVYASESGLSLPFVGLKNYNELLFKNPTYLKLMVDSLLELAINFPCVLMFSFFIGIVLNQKFKGRALARAIFFLPVIISSGVILQVQDNTLQSTMASAIASSASGSEGGISQLTSVVTGMISTIEISPGIMSFITGAVDRVYDITIASGVQILIYLAGLQNISPSLYEASSIEGATAWENFWKITVPMVSPMIMVNAIYTIIDSVCGMNNAMIAQIHSYAFDGGAYGYASAMNWLYFPIIFILIGVFWKIANKFVYYQ